MNKFPKHPPLTRWQSLGLHAFVLLPVLGVLVALLNGISMQTIVSIAVGVPLALIFIGIPVALGLGIFFTLLGKAFI